jgi:hypothetical protein
MSNIVPYGEIERMATAVAKSGLFGVKTADQALALMLVAQAEGRHPALAARDYDVIQGRPSKKSEAMMRDFLQSGGTVEWHDLTDAIADATFAHPSGGKVRISWDMKRAQAAGLGGKDMWKKYPRQMLRARAVSEGIRTVCPMATSGMYVPEEVQDFQPEKNITPTSGASERVDPSKASEIDALAVKMQEFCSEGQYEDAVLEAENAALDADQMTYLWTQFDSATRRELKKASKAIKERYSTQVVATAPTETLEQTIAAVVGDDKISDAQRKRIEAIISKHKLNREDLKLKCSETWNAASFADLTKEQYKEFDEYVAGIIEFANETEAKI